MIATCTEECNCTPCKKNRAVLALRLGQMPPLSLVAVAVKQALGIRTINRR